MHAVAPSRPGRRDLPDQVGADQHQRGGGPCGQRRERVVVHVGTDPGGGAEPGDLVHQGGVTGEEEGLHASRLLARTDDAPATVAALWRAGTRAGPVDAGWPGGRPVARDRPTMADMSRPTAAFFDLDKTIIAKSSILAFGRPFQAGGLISRRAMLRSTYAQFVYLVGGADHDQMEKMRGFMSALCAGWDVATVREIVADTLHNIVDPIVYDEAVSLIEEHHRAGRDVVIVSTSGSEVVEPIGEMLGADRVVATRMEIVDGRYSGEIEYYAYAEEKARAIEDLAELVGYDLAQCYAYSDSVTDVPMLRVVGHPHAVNPDRELRKVAVAEDWPVLVFDKPVALRSRMPLPPARTTLAALAVGGAVAAGGVLWANARKRRDEA